MISLLDAHRQSSAYCENAICADASQSNEKRNRAENMMVASR